MRLYFSNVRRSFIQPVGYFTTLYAILLHTIRYNSSVSISNNKLALIMYLAYHMILLFGMLVPGIEHI